MVTIVGLLRIMKRYLFRKNEFDDLARRMQYGDEEAASRLYDELAGKVFGFCMNRVRDRALAEDLTQEIFLKLVSRIETFDPKKGTFTVWFWQMARNAIIDHYRKQKEIVFADIKNEYAIPEVAVSHNIELDVEGRLEREKVGAFVKQLSAEEQELFRLHYLAELSYKEIADVVRKSEGALRVAVSRLKKKLRRALA